MGCHYAPINFPFSNVCGSTKDIAIVIWGQKQKGLGITDFYPEFK